MNRRLSHLITFLCDQKWHLEQHLCALSMFSQSPQTHSPKPEYSRYHIWMHPQSLYGPQNTLIDYDEHTHVYTLIVASSEHDIIKLEENENAASHQTECHTTHYVVMHSPIHRVEYNSSDGSSMSCEFISADRVDRVMIMVTLGMVGTHLSGGLGIQSVASLVFRVAPEEPQQIMNIHSLMHVRTLIYMCTCSHVRNTCTTHIYRSVQPLCTLTSSFYHFFLHFWQLHFQVHHLQRSISSQVMGFANYMQVYLRMGRRAKLTTLYITQSLNAAILHRQLILINDH